MRFDRIAVLDWSAARGRRRGPDSIWLGVVDGGGEALANLPTRSAAEAALAALIARARSEGARLLIGADFAFGYPGALAERVTGQAAPLALWDWLAARVVETEGHGSTFRAVAAAINGQFGDRHFGGGQFGGGPFWGDGTAAGTPGLPRLKPELPGELVAHRATELAAREDGERSQPKTVWQLAGAGAVGAQALTGIPVLARLRSAHAPDVAVWPFEPVERAPVVLAEVYPSLLAAAVARRVTATGECPDAAQVDVLAQVLWRLSAGGLLAPLFEVPVIARREGWILGAGQARVLRAAAAQP